MQSVSTAQVSQDRLIAGLSAYLASGLLKAVPAGVNEPAPKTSASPTNPTAGAVKAITTRRAKFGAKTVSPSSLATMLAKAKAARSASAPSK